MISRPTRSGTLRSDADALALVESRRGDRGRRGRRADGSPLAAACPMRPSPTGISSVAPGIRPDAVGGHVHDRGALGIEEPDAAPRAADEAGHRAADRLQQRPQVEPRADELAGAVERGQLLGALGDLRVEPRALDGGGERPRHLRQDSTSPSVKAWGWRCPTASVPSTSPWERSGSQDGGATPDVERISAGSRAEPRDRRRRRPARPRGAWPPSGEGATQRDAALARAVGHRAPDTSNTRSCAALAVDQRERRSRRRDQAADRLRRRPKDLVQRDVRGGERVTSLMTARRSVRWWSPRSAPWRVRARARSSAGCSRPRVRADLPAEEEDTDRAALCGRPETREQDGRAVLASPRRVRGRAGLSGALRARPADSATRARSQVSSAEPRRGPGRDDQGRAAPGAKQARRRWPRPGWPGASARCEVGLGGRGAAGRREQVEGGLAGAASRAQTSARRRRRGSARTTAAAPSSRASASGPPTSCTASGRPSPSTPARQRDRGQAREAPGRAEERVAGGEPSRGRPGRDGREERVEARGDRRHLLAERPPPLPGRRGSRRRRSRAPRASPRGRSADTPRRGARRAGRDRRPPRRAPPCCRTWWIAA